MFGEGVKRKPSYAFFKAEFQLLELPKDFRYNEERKMSMKNELAKDITLAEWKSQYDMQCKKVLSNRTILAWILRDTVQEFSTMPVPDIMKCIGDDLQVSSVRVEPGNTNRERIIGQSNEDKIPDEGEIYYDIRFSALAPTQGQKIRLILLMSRLKRISILAMISQRGGYFTEHDCFPHRWELNFLRRIMIISKKYIPSGFP